MRVCERVDAGERQHEQTGQITCTAKQGLCVNWKCQRRPTSPGKEADVSARRSVNERRERRQWASLILGSLSVISEPSNRFFGCFFSPAFIGVFLVFPRGSQMPAAWLHSERSLRPARINSLRRQVIYSRSFFQILLHLD